jgi:hypothetical protein
VVEGIVVVVEDEVDEVVELEVEEDDAVVDVAVVELVAPTPEPDATMASRILSSVSGLEAER